jgi:glycosyltransferase involved in cell wall biosynthesis
MKDRGRLSLVDPRMVDEFTHRLDLMLSDQEVRTLWKDWASEYVKQFDYRCIVDRYEKIYQELLVNEPQLTR